MHEIFINLSVLIFELILGFIGIAACYHIICGLTGKYSAERRDRRIAGLENKLAEYSPHINWKTYRTDEEYYND